MVRFLITVLFSVIANAIGLIVAAAILDDMSLTASGFSIAVLIFTGVVVLVQPLIQKTALKQSSSALSGSSALLAGFVGLVVAAIVSDSLQIDGALTWVLATVIVWAAGLLAGVILPLVLFKRVMQERRQ
jgi:putative membrane protein